MSMITGRCLCAAVQFSFPDDFQYAGYCHCSECRRFSGSLFSAQGAIEAERLTINTGAECIGRYYKTQESVMCFCRNCGSSLYVEKPERGMAHIRYGALNELPSMRPQAHIFVGSKVPWETINDGLPQFDGAPDR